MAKKRKKWEPEYRFGGNPSSFYRPRPLGENQNAYAGIAEAMADQWGGRSPRGGRMKNRILNRLCHIVCETWPKTSFPLWVLERAARHHFGRALGP